MVERHPKRRSIGPIGISRAAIVARFYINPRNGAISVPAATMMTGRVVVNSNLNADRLNFITTFSSKSMDRGPWN